jgi:hypothetical protein
MRLKKPIRALIDQVRITREGNDAIIDYADAGISGTRLTIGPQIVTMTDRDIVDVFNGILAAQERLLAGWNKTVIEERSRFRSTTKNYLLKSSGGCCGFMRVGACGSPSCPRNSYQKIQRSKSEIPRRGSDEAPRQLFNPSQWKGVPKHLDAVISGPAHRTAKFGNATPRLSRGGQDENGSEENC